MKVRTDLKAGSDFELEEDVLESDSLDLGEETGMFLRPPSDSLPPREVGLGSPYPNPVR